MAKVGATIGLKKIARAGALMKVDSLSFRLDLKSDESPLGSQPSSSTDGVVATSSGSSS